MVAAISRREDAEVALQNGGFGELGHAVQAEARRELALVHHAFADEVGILAVLDHERVEHAAVGERAAQDVGVRDALRPIGVGDGADLPEQAEFGHLLARKPLGQRRHRHDADEAAVPGAALHEVDRGRVVERRLGVRLADDGGDAAGGRRLAGGAEGLAVLLAGLADEDAHVDEARSDHHSGAVPHRDAAHRLQLVEMGADVADDAGLDQYAASLVAARCRVYEAAVGEEQRRGGIVGHG